MWGEPGFTDLSVFLLDMWVCLWLSAKIGWWPNLLNSGSGKEKPKHFEIFGWLVIKREKCWIEILDLSGSPKQSTKAWGGPSGSLLARRPSSTRSTTPHCSRVTCCSVLEASEVMTNFFSVTLFLKHVSFNSQKEEKNDCNNLSV